MPSEDGVLTYVRRPSFVRAVPNFRSQTTESVCRFLDRCNLCHWCFGFLDGHRGDPLDPESIQIRLDPSIQFFVKFPLLNPLRKFLRRHGVVRHVTQALRVWFVRNVARFVLPPT